MSGNKRRQHKFVHGIQGMLVARMISQWAVFVASVAAVTVLLQFARDPLAKPGVWMAQLRETLTSIGIVVGCLLPIFIWDSIKFSHRFVGPIIRLQNLVRRIGCEPTEPMKLRTSDYWVDLADDVNQMMDRVGGAPRTNDTPGTESAALGVSED